MRNYHFTNNNSFDNQSINYLDLNVINDLLRVKMKYIVSLVFILLSFQLLHAGCGGCRPVKKSPTSQSQKVGLLESIPSTKRIQGNVLVSCGMCNFYTDNNDCSLAVKIGKTVLEVKGVGIDDHGDSHAKDGYCNVIKKVYVEGIVRKNSFYATKMDVSKI